MAKKNKIKFNPNTLRFEQYKKSWRETALEVAMYASGIIVFSFIAIMISHKFFPSPNEAKLIKQIDFQNKQIESLNKTLDFVINDLNILKDKDKNLYRVIYQKEPIDDKNFRILSAKDSAYFANLKKNSNFSNIIDLIEKINLVLRNMETQNKSYNDLILLVEKRQEMINSIPSIQPIANKDLTRISSGYGWRIHPIYRIQRLHTGIDFTAPKGTAIYATADGSVEVASNQGNGYGNEIIIDHGYGYKTRYAHLSKFYIAKGQTIKRGQKIGAVGSTGASVGPHLHYEVEYLNEKIDPALFFFNDINSAQYQELINITNSGGQSFD
ncbi:MAG: M23 family metallopeptidase [Chitinophagales bacterium]|jgi:murein DD-endopeptidase MepM/ murein hydrolase activator NlpD|nr:M23 family metallopeptidase [Chitinophagales bacterium]